MSKFHPLLVLRPIHTALGDVDGLWYPRTRDLVIEADRIIGQLSDAIGTINRVVYRINDWTLISPPVASIHDHEVQFEGYWRPKYATNTFIGKRGSIELATLMPTPLVCPDVGAPVPGRPRVRRSLTTT